MYTGISLLGFSLFSVSSAAVCSSVMGSNRFILPWVYHPVCQYQCSLHTCFSLACTLMYMCRGTLSRIVYTTTWLMNTMALSGEEVAFMWRMYGQGPYSVAMVSVDLL